MTVRRMVLAGAALAALLAAVGGWTSGNAARPRDPALCTQLFHNYDQAAWMFPSPSNRRGRFTIPPGLQRPVQDLRTNGCLTLSSDLDGMPALAARLTPHRVVDSGAAIRPTPVQLGVVLSIGDESRATQFFRGLGYRSRGVGAEGLGRQLLIGPFASQGAVDEALSIAREAGFISPIVPQHTRF